MNSTVGTAVLESLVGAVNRHDLDGLVDHFAADVRSSTPAHPARSFTGRDQVRRNWSQILGAVRDLVATITSISTGSGGTQGATIVWAELALDGHRPDGGPWQMRGVTVNEVVDGRIAAVRFYLEPVDDLDLDADAAARSLTGSAAPITVAGTVR